LRAEPMLTHAPGEMLRTLPLPSPLVNAERLSWVTGALRDLPAAVVWTALECRLGASCEVDALVCITNERFGRPVFLEHLDRARPAGRAWERAHAFFRAWAEPGGLLDRHVPYVWLEIDGSSTAGEPFVVFTTQPRNPYDPATRKQRDGGAVSPTPVPI